MTYLEDIADVIEEGDEYLVVCHVNPDGDAIGSAYALVLALRLTGKRADAAVPGEVPDNYRALTDRVDRQALRHPRYICVDTSTQARLGKYADEHILCCIDHHEKNTVDARYNYVDPTASSCAQIVYELIQILGAPVSQLMADLLYTGLITDTSCFRAVTTNADTMRYASVFAACGADVSGLARKYFLTKSPRRLDIEDRLRRSRRFFADGRIAGFVLKYADYVELGITDSDVEGINDIAEEPQGIKAGIVVREKNKGKCRISVRAVHGCKADEICAAVGGGGHANAAGAAMDGDPDEVLEKIAAIAEECIRRRETL
ncbi:MAG: DHH family phosphoesterase [Oscillospiraceae bacterium]|nr:DHH family phosphoesterase [Oscillospiraceae bacterium]